MITFLFTFVLAAILVVGGMMGSLHLRTHRLSTRRRLSGLRRSYAAPMDYTTAANSSVADRSSHYTRKALVILILLLAMLSMIIVNAINALIH